MTAAKYNLVIEQGATLEKKFRWRDSNGEAIDLAGWSAELTIREIYGTDSLVLSSANGDITFQPSDASEDEVDEPALAITPLAIIVVRCSKETTGSIGFRVGRYMLDLIDPDGDQIRLIEGSVTINPEVKQ